MLYDALIEAGLSTDEIEKILKFGAKDFLTKPIEIAKLLNTLKKHLTEK